MSTRGINFLHQWLSDSLPGDAKTDIVTIAALTDKLFADAKAEGIRRFEIDDELLSLYRTILDAIEHAEAGLAD